MHFFNYYYFFFLYSLSSLDLWFIVWRSHGKILRHYCFSSASVPFFSFCFFWYFHYVYATNLLQCCPVVFRYFVRLFYMFFFCFWVLIVSLEILFSSEICYSVMFSLQSTNEPITGFLFITFLFQVFLYHFLEFPPFCLHYPSVLECYVCFPLIKLVY